jgi:DNA-binding MarR family transcriptional regulator
VCSAARALSRHFDDAFRALDLTNGQFSLLMALNRPEPPSIGELAHFLAMDRTTLTAMTKPMEKRGILEVLIDPIDRRRRRLRLTAGGHALLKCAYPLWRRAHAELDDTLADADVLRDLLTRIAPLELTHGRAC